MKIGLFGYGVVGSGVVELLSQPNLKDTFSIEKIVRRHHGEGEDPRVTLDPNEILMAPEIEVVMECMGGLEPAHTYVKQALEQGKHVITANKKMLAAHLLELLELAQKNRVYLLYEASVAGGIPWMTNMARLGRVDTISFFQGIMNGTTNYILTKMAQEGIPFETVLKQAQELGYAETDPTDDIDGFDVQNKCALTIMQCFNQVVSPSDIPTHGIRSIQEEDMEYAKRVNGVIKLLASGVVEEGKLCAYVMPRLVSKEDLYGVVDANFNVVEATGSSLGRNSYIGQGAGKLPTAHAMVQDLWIIEKNEFTKATNITQGTNTLEKEGIFYLRHSEVEGQEWLEESVGKDAFLTKKIPLRFLINFLETHPEESSFVMEMMNS